MSTSKRASGWQLLRSPRPLEPAVRRPRRHSLASQLLAGLLAVLMAWLPVLQTARAQEGDDAPTSESYELDIDTPVEEAAPFDGRDENLVDGMDEHDPDGAARGQLPDDTGQDALAPLALPGGQAASGVTPQAISLPNAEGSVEGMGESFTPHLSSGTASFSVPIAVAPGRAGVQPSLALSYSTTGGNGAAGFGWGLGAPFISRQTDRGMPRYDDRAAWHPEEDRFIYNGGQELVPVDNDGMAAVDVMFPAGAGRLDGATSYGAANVPTDLASYQQYRARVEGGFMRFFRSPDARHWVVQSKDGTRFDFGILPDLERGPRTVEEMARGVEADPEDASRIERWCLTRMSDPHGSTVHYRYRQDGNRAYLAEIFYTSPGTCGVAGDPVATRQCTSSLEAYAARVGLEYETRGDIYTSYTSGWPMAFGLRLQRVTVTAWNATASSRTLVRRYHLGYDPTAFHSLLTSVQVEGRPERSPGSFGNAIGDDEVREDTLGDAIIGRTLPAMTFAYTGDRSGGGVTGFEALSTTVESVVSSPPHSVDEGRSDLFDVNSDGLPDLIVTDPARFRTSRGGPAVGVFFNGFTGSNASPAGATATFSDGVPMPMAASLATTLNLANLNIRPMDIDGDGHGDLLHMPRRQSYGWFAPTRAPPTDAVAAGAQGWEWSYYTVDLPEGDTDPRIDLGRDGSHFRQFDVNNDHLIDIVRTTGTVMQTWLNLGWLEGGEGRFGSATYSDDTGWTLSTQPLESCLMYAGTPVDFEDPDVRLADMNGDGLQDIARLSRTRILYWPGRGTGVWGVGPRDCDRGEGEGRYIEMATPPTTLPIDLEGVSLSDVDGDGASDIVVVRFSAVDVYYNRAGQGWTDRTTVRGTPASPGFVNRVRFTDIDGSGTQDVVWAQSGNWQYLDLMGGTRPRLLDTVDNGLGALTTITYGSSAEDYVRDLEAAESCSGGSVTCDRFTWDHAEVTSADLSDPDFAYRSAGSPVISTVVRGVATSDRFDVLGRDAQVTESAFAYHDGYYEGIEQEFRGFGAADAETVGDWNHPSSFSRTWFLQGRRPAAIAADRLAENPNEALKGREVMTEVFDANGTYLSTSMATVTDRLLHTGLDGREIHYAFVSETNELRYDTTPFDADGSTIIPVDAVRFETVSGSGITLDSSRTRPSQLISRGARLSRLRTTFDVVDNLGHVLQQTAWGRVDLTAGATPVGDERTDHMENALLGGLDGQWLWRTTRQYRDVLGAGTAFGDTRTVYDTTTGDPLEARVHVTGPDSGTQYDFGANGDVGQGDALGFAMPTAGLSGTTPSVGAAYLGQVSSTVHDEWGNTLATCAGGNITTVGFSSSCLRYGEVDYSADPFEQLPTSETIQTGPTSSLTTQGTFDRGLGTVLAVTDPNALVTTATYDGLGRITSSLPPPVAACGTSNTTPTSVLFYELTTTPSAQPLSRVRTETFTDCAGTDVLESMAYIDGLGRTRAALATSELTGEWIRSGITTLDDKGTVRRTYQTDRYTGSATDHASVVALPASIPYAVTRYDAFGRARGVIAEDGSTTWTSYHSLSTDVCDPLDNDPSSEHYRTCTTARTDGHGRVIDQVLRNRRPGGLGALEEYRLFSYYRADDAVLALIRAETASARPASFTAPGLPADDHVVRTFDYDSVGRRWSSVDLDTQNPDSGLSASERNWRYLFNRVGDLVAVRDPRGCGQNFFYDLAGRLRGEQYVACSEAQDSASELPTESVVDLVALGTESTVSGLDVVYHFDAYPTWLSGVSPTERPAVTTTRGVQGLPTGVTDRGQRSVVGYDARGNAVWTARQLALIPEALPLSETLAGDLPVVTEGLPLGGPLRVDPHLYERTATFDHAGRPESMALPAEPYDRRDEDPGTPPATATAAANDDGPVVGGRLTYNPRGLPASAHVTAAGADVQTVIEAITYLRDGLVAATRYGDNSTSSSTLYDVRRRPARMTTTRTASAGAMPSELQAVELVADQELVWDAANNLTATIDHRRPDEWGPGFRPQSVSMRHDSLYRVVEAFFEYTQDSGASGGDSIAASDSWRAEMRSARASVDPMQTDPAPLVTGHVAPRVRSLVWSWDYLANTTEWTDDQSQFYERSIGTIVNGTASGAGPRPSALYLASNLPPTATLGDVDRAGYLSMAYGAGGNLVSMTVHGRCAADGAPTNVCGDSASTDVSQRLTDLAANCFCAREQHYQYRWDALNRLVEARRYDRHRILQVPDEVDPWVLGARQRYRYDSANQRTVKQTLSSSEVGTERVSLYVFPGDYERRGLAADAALGRYAVPRDLGGTPLNRLEAQYLVAGARVAMSSAAMPSGSMFDRDYRITLGVTDLIQTTSAVVDLRSGDLVEASTYYPNGARETWRRDEDTAGLAAAEPMGFTGKEADEEVGVVYFGERYLVPRVGRWASPDPLHVHASGGGEALNSYHYVGGNLLAGRDPIGLEDGVETTQDADGNPWHTFGDELVIAGESSLTVPDGDGGEVPRQAEREVADQRFRESGARTHGSRTVASSVLNLAAGIYNEGLSQMPGLSLAVGVYRYVSGDGRDLVAMIEDTTGLDTGVDRYSTEYGAMAEGTSIPRLFFMAALGGLSGRFSPAGGGGGGSGGGGGPGGGGGGSGRGRNHFRPAPEAEGRPHTMFRRNPSTDRIENYQTYDAAGAAGGNRRFRGTGRPHGGVEPPLVLEPRSGRPGGRPSRARPARPDELPRGF
jgi:RHS repeat-associated protein